MLSGTTGIFGGTTCPGKTDAAHELANANELKSRFKPYLAGAGGFEPPNAGSKNP